MQNILRKRVWRDLRANWVRYLALSLLVVLAMYLVVSLIGAAETIIRGSQASDRAHHVEDGAFSLFVPMTEEEWETLQEDGVALEKMFYLDYQTKEKKTIRVFADRQKINTVTVTQGKKASSEKELLIERKFAETNGIQVGDSVEIGGCSFTVSGIGVTPDYNSMLKSLGDSTCDSANFGTAFVTADTYSALQREGKASKSEEYMYAYRLRGRMTAKKLKEKLKKLQFRAGDVQDAYFQEYWDRTMGRRDDLTDGIRDLADGAKELAEGLEELADQNENLTDGADAVWEATLQQANETLQEYGVAQLTENNYAQILEQEISHASGAVMRLSYRTLLEQLEQLHAYKEGVAEYTQAEQEAADGAGEVQEGTAELKQETDDALDELFSEDTTNLLSFVEASENARIQAASGDQELYRSVGMIAGAVILVLIAYVLSVFVVHTIDRESAVIGALYALGVKRRQLMTHYVLLPTGLTFLAGVIGTLLGYSGLGVPVQMQDCYAYYSLPDLDVVMTPYLLVYGIVIPPLISAIVNVLVIRKRLSRPVLALLRNEHKAVGGKEMHLQGIGFMKLFQIRQMLREKRTGFTVVFGIFVSMLLVMMSLEIYVYCRNVEKEYVADTKYAYMYTYKYPTKKVPDGGYQAYAKTLEKSIYGYSFDVTVLGLTEENPFFDVPLTDSEGKVTISSSIAYKYGLKAGDTLTLQDEETDRLYAFEIADVSQYSPTFMVFMSYDKALELFGEQEDDYNVVFADHALQVDSGRLYSVTTKEDIEKAAGIFSDKMQSMIVTLGAVSVVIFVIVLYLMMKVMVDRSSFQIALVKIFGYRDREVKRMYLDGNFYIVLIGTLLSIPVSKWIMDAVYEPAFVPNVSCGISKAFSPWIYGAIFVGVLALYFLINHFLIRRIRTMTPAEVLKERE